uniref:U11-Eretoxin-Ek1bu_1 n=1 Tax=Eresus cinnaberinus TaxID=175337 RepID=A0A2D0PCS6_ERECI
MVSHVTSIVSLFALLLGLAECAKCPYAKFTPQHSFCKDPNPKCTILERGLQPADKQRLVDLHNMYREKVASGKEAICKLCTGNGGKTTFIGIFPAHQSML